MTCEIQLSFDIYLEISSKSLECWQIMLSIPSFGRFSLTKEGEKFANRFYSKIVEEGEERRIYLANSLIYYHNSSGLEIWYKNGIIHRKDDLPAIMRKVSGNIQTCYENLAQAGLHSPGVCSICSKGILEWWKNGERHRDNDLPAIIFLDNSRHWYSQGKIDRGGDKPAVMNSNGVLEWWRVGKLHREKDLPAVIWSDGSSWWYKNGVLHRDDDKPAVIWSDGSSWWYKNGLLHRKGKKPAIELENGKKQWYIDGCREGILYNLSCKLLYFLSKITYS